MRRMRRRLLVSADEERDRRECAVRTARMWPTNPRPQSSTTATGKPQTLLEDSVTGILWYFDM